ncbi:hypothetical protein HDV04_005614 [Boothiomyces sp. JEL0838]|nr:hypothetical protein HDV04_005614 [Boothiomyces sp. JEL0838]
MCVTSFCGLKSYARGYNGVVATEHELCSEVGVNVLKDGGSAIDSAVATCICIGTVNFYASGIGGGGFMVHRAANGETTVFDFREEAPAAAFTNMFVKDPMSAQLGGLSVAVPGELRGLELAHRKFGKLPWKRLFQPSIEIARNGFRVNKAFEAKTKSTKAEIEKDPILQKLLAPNGKLLVEGDWLKRPEFARTLESIANEGADVFYNGWIADELIKTINRTGGIVTHEDFQNYKAKESQPLVGSYRGLKVISAPPPASGAVLLSVLNVIENYSEFDKLNPLNTHRLVEALKHGYAERGFYGDPIDTRTFPVEYYNPEFENTGNHGTMHMSILSKEGDAVALTSTVNLLFGSKVVDPVTGIVLNDEMDDFSIPGVSNSFGLAPSPYNYVHPGKRPQSSSAPVIIEKDGKVFIVSGASGGSHITTSTAQSIIRMIDLDSTPYEAVMAPRVHHQLLPDEVEIESFIPKEVEEGLRERGHEIKKLKPTVYTSCVSSLKRLSSGLILGAGDERKNGQASAY